MQIGKLVVIGVGLIGASFALALRAAGAVGEVVGVGRGKSNLDAALAAGAIDRAYRLDGAWKAELRDADVVLLATPVGQYADLFRAIAPCLDAGFVLTDAGSTKRGVVTEARDAFGAGMARFVPGHPIAGGERSGASAASAQLFAGRNVVLTPVAETAADSTALVQALWTACGARVCQLTPDDHDRVFAAVSHLPHLAAIALVADVAARADADALLALAGSGFRDFTRIAASSPEMWRDIALANRDALRAEIARLRAALASADASLAARDGAALEALFARAATARRRWDASLPIADDGA
ncbi:MAG: prephenate dehydrogenase/arogenate dehydrogenase family protein [Betaproteobacteria bacterium]